jgi:hypothetical protein
MPMARALRQTYAEQVTTREVDGRTIIVCDHCRASLDLGPPPARDPFPRRSPTGWRETGQNQHLCTLCSPGYTASFIRRFG